MRILDPARIDTIVIHTTAGAADATVEDIRRYHVERRGFSDVGYHFLIWRDGTVAAGRAIQLQGAHARGYNHRSLGIALVGHHDREPLTDAARDALVDLAVTLAHTYGVASADIIGHREVYDRMGDRRLKTCPGTRVDMDDLRAACAERRERIPSDGVS